MASIDTQEQRVLVDYRGPGWLFSLTLHGGALALAMHAGIDLPVAQKPTPFQWDVVLAMSAPVNRPAAATPATEIPQPATAARPSRIARPSPQAAPEPVVRQVVEATPAFRTVQPIQREKHLPAPITREVMRRPTQGIEHSVAEPTNVVQEIVQQEAIVAESVFQTRDVLPKEVAQERPPVVPQDIESHAKAEEIQQVVANEAHTGAVEPIIRAPVTEDLAAAIVENAAVHHKQPTAVSQEPAMQAARIEARQERRVEARPSGQADFGWLAESLWRRIEDLKRYPSVARARRWEGKVVVEAIIRHDGEILDCHIAESSGHGVLDQDALSVLRRASPLHLKHPLGRPQITILLPITYRLHG